MSQTSWLLVMRSQLSNIDLGMFGSFEGVVSVRYNVGPSDKDKDAIRPYSRTGVSTNPVIHKQQIERLKQSWKDRWKHCQFAMTNCHSA